MGQRRCLTWDVTFPDTIATSHIASTSYLPGAAAEHAATLEKQKYAALSQAHEFVPLAIETSGVFNSEGLDFVKKIGVDYPMHHQMEKRLLTCSSVHQSRSREGTVSHFLDLLNNMTITGSLLQGEASFKQCDNNWEPAPRRGF